MNKKEEQLAHLAEIRSIMERSSRFISLSGLSGIFAGAVALLGAAIVYWYMGYHYNFERSDNVGRFYYSNAGISFPTFALLVGSLVFVTAFIGGVFFTSRKAKREGAKMWNSASKRLLVNLGIPLLTGAGFTLLLLKMGHVYLVAPSTLVFYGLALLNGSKYTLDDIRYLGISEIVLGLLAMYFIGYGLLFWAIGFGVLHIVYGVLMYLKYEQ